MRSNGLATILLIIPVLAVPALAIFGIPQFAPIVSSPLEEGHDFDRETGVGKSERPIQDEFYSEFSNAGSESGGADKSISSGRNSLTHTRGRQKLNSNRSKEPRSSTWDRDWGSATNWPDHSQPNSAVDEPSAELVEGSTAPPRTLKSLNAEESPPQLGSRKSTPSRKDDAIRPASATDEDLSSSDVNEANAVEASEIRRQGRQPASKRKPEKPSESLTWKTAVQRLNELDIRSFRVEPSHQADQFVCICSYSPPNSPRISYRFEAEAEEPLRAVEKVLEQIVEWQRKQ